ncbi:hypothetical protein [Photobacterium leiognathi]|uniref:hypothetical protein n=1 Tax=Photobacterium leiognathi TaxID=553611 RepID=UPI0027370BDD|nr:hypothetical protein [Photobacterium leiognathi]
MRINSTPSHTANAAQAAPSDKPQTSGIGHQTPLLASLQTKASNPVSQLPQLLLSINSLQRLVTLLFNPLNSGTAKLTTPLPNNLNAIFQQLFAPNNQASLIAWLQQGGERKPLAQLLQQLSQPQSPLNQWLKTLSLDQQQDVTALLRLAGEQRGPETQRSQESNTIHLQYPVSNEQFIDIKVKNESDNSNSNADKNINSCWTVKLTLPIGAIDILNVTAQWKNRALNTAFSTSNAALLARVEKVTPLLLARMKQLGITCEAPSFQHQPNTDVEAENISHTGLHIKV